jgi:hypothetical protein
MEAQHRRSIVYRADDELSDKLSYKMRYVEL